MRIRATAAMTTVLLWAAVSASAQAPAQAAAPPGQVEVTLYGAGGSSCGQWLADREKPMHHVELNWVLGFVTASENFFGELKLPMPRHTDANAITAWVDKYCRENPLKNIADASANLVIELAKPN
jgi:hypothetical protein